MRLAYHEGHRGEHDERQLLFCDLRGALGLPDQDVQQRQEGEDVENLEVRALREEEERVLHAVEIAVLQVFDELRVDRLDQALDEGLLRGAEQVGRAGVDSALRGERADAG